MTTSDNERFKFSGRGLGQNWFPCFICGHKPMHKCQADQAFFVDSALVTVSSVITDGDGKPLVYHPLVDWFHDQDVLLGKLDYRDFEPHHVQVKLGACGEHEPNLELLGLLCRQDDNHISQRTLARVIPQRRRP